MPKNRDGWLIGWLKAEDRWLKDHPGWDDESLRELVDRDGALFDEDEQRIASPQEPQERQW